MGRGIRINKSGFTLVELSIVLVIIGLLIGGILVGQSLIESVKLNSQVRQFQQYDIALKGFYGKFRAIPGDSTTVRFTTGFTLTPDGDGVMRDFIGRVPINWLNSESSTYFPLLADQGFLTENYIRQPHNVNTIFVGEGTQYPEIKLNDDGTRAMYALTNRAGDIFYFMGMRETAQHSNPQVSTTSTAGVISPAQALTLDKKMDDGLPDSGDVAASTNQTNQAAGRFYPFNLDTTACVSSGAYNLAVTDDETCRMIIKAASFK